MCSSFPKSTRTGSTPSSRRERELAGEAHAIRLMANARPLGGSVHEREHDAAEFATDRTPSSFVHEYDADGGVVHGLHTW
jgi:hypothetical protein